MLFSLLLALLTLGVNVAVSMAFTYNRQQADKMDLENYRLQEELKYLKQQISPHFFMNVLNNIHEMTEEDVGKAQEMILELSRLMRYVLYESENGSTTLAAEAQFISSYVSLMKRRYLEDVVKVSLELPQHYENQKGCIEHLLSCGIIPIVNENDTISVTELMFTDNDELSGWMAQMMSCGHIGSCF